MKLKKLLPALLAFAAMTIICAVCAGAEEYTSGLWRYEPVNSSEAYITAYSGFNKSLAIPSKLDSYTITGIKESAFENSTVKNVTIPNTVKYIGYKAFYNSALESVTVPSSVTSWGTSREYFDYLGYANCSYAFADCDKLTTVTFNAKEVPDGIFEDCDILNKVTINYAKTIGHFAFNECTKLTVAEINSRPTSIGWYAFENSSLKKITLPNSITTIGYRAFSNTDLASVTVPSSVTSWGVARKYFDYLGYANCSYAFADCDKLTAVTFNAKEVPDGIFEGCDILNKVTFNYAKTIGNFAFSDCPKLTVAEINSRPTSIGWYAFENSSLKKITLPNSITTIGYRAFSNTDLVSVTVPSSVTSWGAARKYFDYLGYANCSYAFADCDKLTTVTFNAKEVPDGIFEGCDILNKATINYAKTIGHFAFNDCSKLVDVQFNSYLDSIGWYSFSNTGIKNIELPETLYHIGYQAFYNTKLTSVIIPAGMTSWGVCREYFSDLGYMNCSEAFGNCPNLKKVVVGEQFLPFRLFYGSDNVTIYCIKGTKAEQFAKDYGISYVNTLKSVPVSNVSFQRQTYTLRKGDSFMFYPDVTPTNTTNLFSWESGNENIATVNDRGIITGKMTGTVAIKCTASNGTEAYCVVNVVDSGTTTADRRIKKDISGVKVTINSQYYTGSEITPTPTVMINDVTALKKDRDYTVEFSDNVDVGIAVATLTGKGIYTGTKTVFFEIKNLETVQNFKVKARSSTNVTLQWSSVSGAAGYVLDIYKNGSWTTAAKITGGSVTEYTVRGLTAGTAGYKFRIRAYNGSAYSEYSATLTVNTNPYGVGGFKVKTITSTNVTLQWNKGTTASGYELQQVKDGKWATIYTADTASATTYTVRGLKAGTAGYRFRIRAYKTYGSTKQYGSWSNEVSVNTNPYGVGGFKVKSKSSTNITLQWNKGTTASGYQLQQYKNGQWTTIATLSSASTVNYTVKGLAAGTAGYRFRIRAYKTYGSTKQYGSWSNEVSVNTNPYGVGGFKVKSKTASSITLQWNKGTTASGYELQQYKNGKWVTITTPNKAATTSYTVKSLKANTSYSFRIRAYKTYGSTKQYGSWSSTLAVRTNK